MAKKKKLKPKSKAKVQSPNKLKSLQQLEKENKIITLRSQPRRKVSTGPRRDTLRKRRQITKIKKLPYKHNP